MWNAIVEFCKVFAEKHLIPSVISIVGAIISLIFIPSDYWIIVKIGKFLFFILVAGVDFLVVKFLVFCWHKFVSYKSDNDLKQYYSQNATKSEKKNIEELWTAVDKFSPDDRKLLHEFLESDNAPITRSSGNRYFGNSLLASNWVVSTEEYGEEEQPIILSEKLKGKAIPIGAMSAGRAIVVKYKLHDDIYSALKYSKEKYGKISHFE